MNKKILILFIIFSCLALINIFIGDHRIFLLINKGLASNILDNLFFGLFIKLFLLLGIVPCIMFFFKKYRALSLFSLISGFSCYNIGDLIKPIVQQPRPFDVLETRTVMSWQIDPFSFPSTTTMMAIGLALPIFLLKPKLGTPLLILSFLVGFFVIYTGYHFPNDVLFGALLSVLIVSFFLKIWEFQKLSI